jgi:hypothetical protein
VQTGTPFDAAKFSALQARLGPMWPAMTLRRRDEQRTLLVLSSVSFDVPAEMHPLLPVYEERYLIYVLALARQPNTHVIYVTSQPILPRLLDYYLDLVPGLNAEEMRRRLVLISVGDSSATPLTKKILDRPRLIERLRNLVPDTERAVILPFVTTSLEAELALRLDVPVYGPHPELGHLGSKIGSRDTFAAAGVAHPRGTCGVRTADDVVQALLELRHQERPPDEAIVKLNDAVSGWGNAIVDLDEADDAAEIRRRLSRLQPEDEALDPESYLAALETDAGVVEERIRGVDFRSPSVQLRASPEGGVEVLSSHDQVLGGPGGQTYHGCRFPAGAEYAAQIARQAASVGAELARQGVIGRFSVDFVATRSGPREWDTYAVEVNLRNGGTTHPTLTLLALTEGDYDPEEARFEVDGTAKHYVATDHLQVPRLHLLTPDDVLDVIGEHGIGWDADTNVGVVFHLISGVPIAGRVGFTAISNTAAGAAGLYNRVESTLAHVAAS